VITNRLFTISANSGCSIH